MSSSRGHPDARRWNERYRSSADPGEAPADERLQRVAHLLQAPGTALEIACGTGSNAIWLAALGWSVWGVDVSIEGLRLARARASRRGLSPGWVVADAARPAFHPAARFDLVIVTRFLDRRVFPWIRSALAPGGRVFYATFNRGRLVRHPGFNPRFVLEPGELAEAFAGFEVQAGEDEEELSWLLARKTPGDTMSPPA